MLSITNLPKTDQIFSYKDYSSPTHEVTHFAASRILFDALAGRLPYEAVNAAITDENYAQVVKGAGIRRSRIDEMTIEDMLTPILFCTFGEKHVLIDGNHRLVKAYEAGIRNYPAIVVAREQWQEYTLLLPPALHDKIAAEL